MKQTRLYPSLFYYTFYRIHISAFQGPRTRMSTCYLWEFMRMSLSLSFAGRPTKCPESAPAARRTSTLPRRSRPSERVGTNSASYAVRQKTSEFYVALASGVLSSRVFNFRSDPQKDILQGGPCGRGQPFVDFKFGVAFWYKKFILRQNFEFDVNRQCSATR